MFLAPFNPTSMENTFATFAKDQTRLYERPFKLLGCRSGHANFTDAALHTQNETMQLRHGRIQCVILHSVKHYRKTLDTGLAVVQIPSTARRINERRKTNRKKQLK